MKLSAPYGIVLAVTVALAMAFFAHRGLAQSKVAYCKNGMTGKVIVIEAGYPCPSGYYRI